RYRFHDRWREFTNLHRFLELTCNRSVWVHEHLDTSRCFFYGEALGENNYAMNRTSLERSITITMSVDDP
ncbi:MAG: hypothetical protein ACPHO8_16425, partial [Mariniblastus sp.]